MDINIKDMTQRDQICIAEEYTTSTGHCHTPSQLNPGEPSHTHIHLTTDRDSTQLNAPPCMGNVEYSPTRTSPGRQGWRVDSAVGRITVCYGIRLRSLVSGVRAYHHDPITFC